MIGLLTFARPRKGGAALLFIALIAGCKAPATEDRPGAAGRPWAPAPEERVLPEEPSGSGGGTSNFDGDGKQAPRASANYVFVPNPEGRAVIVINSQELTIRTIETGNAPTYLETIPGADAALVLNVGSDDASVVRVAEDGALSQRRLNVTRGANTIVMAPDGQHAVVFYDAEGNIAGGDFGDFQSVSVVDLSPGDETATTIAVGFKPERIVFQEDSQRAFVLTEQGISVLDFDAISAAGSGIAPAFAFDSNRVDRATIVVTPDGRYAIGNPGPGEPELRMLDLETGQEYVRQFWRLLPTFVPDWQTEDWEDLLRELPQDAPFPFERARIEAPRLQNITYDPEGRWLYATDPNQSVVVRIAIPEGIAEPAPFEIQAVEHDISHAKPFVGTDYVLAYRQGAGVSKVSVIDFGLVPDPGAALAMDAGSPEPDAGAPDSGLGDGGVPMDGAMAEPIEPVEQHDLRKGVEYVEFAPGGETAVIVHDHIGGDPNEEDIPLNLRVQRSSAYTILRPGSGGLKLERTKTDPDAIVFSPDGEYAFLLFDDRRLQYPIDEQTSVSEVHQIELARFLTNSIVLLDSPPTAGGIMPDETRAFVAQRHPDGRITFVDWTSGDVRTVTGFELNSRIRN